MSSNEIFTEGERVHLIYGEDCKYKNATIVGLCDEHNVYIKVDGIDYEMCWMKIKLNKGEKPNA